MADVVVLTVVLILTFPPTLGCKVLVWEMFAKAWAILGKIPLVEPCGQHWLSPAVSIGWALRSELAKKPQSAARLLLLSISPLPRR